MLLTETWQPFQFTGTTSMMNNSRISNHAGSNRQRSNPRSSSSFASDSSNARLRLADLARQNSLGVHVENWREDMFPVRQYLPMQHIIGSLKRDRDEQVKYRAVEETTAWRNSSGNVRRQSELATCSPRSEDSFIQMLRTPKRRRTSDSYSASSHCSQADSSCTTDSDPDRRFSYQAEEHVAKDIPTAALPGLNHILNLTSITADERDIFTEYAPKHLEDPQILMNEVLQLREKMMDDEDETGDDMDESSILFGSPIIPPEREDEVRRAFQCFVEMYPGESRFIAKI